MAGGWVSESVRDRGKQDAATAMMFLLCLLFSLGFSLGNSPDPTGQDSTGKGRPGNPSPATDRLHVNI